MNVHRRIVAIGFRIAGALMAIQPVAFLVIAAQALWALHDMKRPGPHVPLDEATYGPWAWVDSGANGLASFLYTILSWSAWLFALVAVVAAIGLVLAILVYLTGRGVGKGQAWARILGGLMCLMVALSAASAARALPHMLALLPAVLLLAALYGLWVLVWRYGEPAP